MRVSLVRTPVLFSGTVLAGLMAALALACSSSSRDSDDHHPSTGSTAGSTAAEQKAAVADQVAHGGKVFAERCARCHGDAGQGTEKAPPLVGKSALPLTSTRPETKRTMPFHTALDVAGFATQNMPPDPAIRAKITQADYWSVIAFDLSANGVELKEPVGPHNAAKIVLHP